VPKSKRHQAPQDQTQTSARLIVFEIYKIVLCEKRNEAGSFTDSRADARAGDIKRLINSRQPLHGPWHDTEDCREKPAFDDIS